MDFSKYIEEVKQEMPQKQKNSKSQTLHFWDNSKIQEFANTLIKNKIKALLPIADIDNNNKKVIGLWNTLINAEHKNSVIKYPAYDLKILIENTAREQNLINFVVRSRNNKLGKNSLLYVDFSKVSKK